MHGVPEPDRNAAFPPPGVAEQSPPPDLETVIRRLVEALHVLHAADRIHRCIASTDFAPQNAGSTQLPPLLEEVRVAPPELDNELTPPDWSLADSVALPADVEAARRILQSAGINTDPRRIDLFQLGVVACRLAAGVSVAEYLRSPRARARVMPPLRTVIDRALGYEVAPPLATLQNWDACWREQFPRHEAETPSTIGRPTQFQDVPAEPVAATSPVDEALPFDRLGHFEIVAKIGRGGMGDVYRGYERALDRTVAIKVLPDEFARQTEFVARFYAEATAAARLIHPNILQIYYIGEDRDRHFFAMQYVDGETLGDRLVRRDQLPLDEVITIGLESLAGLAAAHRAGLVHRDVKPSNILIDRRLNRVLLADFGLVKSAHGPGSATATGVVLGTLDYVSPEQGRGLKLDHRTDLYSMGVVLFQMLAGRLPFEADSPTALIFQHVFEPPPSLADYAPDIPADLVRLVGKLLSKSPEDRYRTAEDVCADLESIRDGRRPTGLEPAGESSQPAQTHRSLAGAATSESSASAVGWRSFAAARWRSLFHRHAPDVLKELQNTEQQIDGAIYEYERRQRELRQLVQDAESALQQLELQATEQRTASRDAEQRASAATSEVDAERARRDAQSCRQQADQLIVEAATQRRDLEDVRIRLAQATARLEQLRNQRDALNARLHVARAQMRIAGRRPARLRGRRWWLALRLGVLVILTVIAIKLWRGRWQAESPAIAVAKKTAIPTPEFPTTAGDEVEELLPHRQLISRKGGLLHFSFNADGSRLAAASADSLEVWESQTGALLQSIDFPNEPISSMVLSPSGRSVFTASKKQGRLFLDKEEPPTKVVEWSTETGSGLREIWSADEPINGLAVDPQGRALFIGTASGKALLWDLVNGREMPISIPLPPLEDVRGIFFPQGNILAVMGHTQRGGQVVLFDWVQSVVKGTLSEHTAGMASMAASNRFWATGDEGGTVLIRSTTDGSVLHKIAMPGRRIASLSFSGDGRQLAIGSQHTASTERGLGEVTIWEAEIGKLHQRVARKSTYLAAFHPRDNELYGTGSTKEILVWESKLPTRVIEEPVATLKGKMAVMLPDHRSFLLVDGTTITEIEVADRSVRRTFAISPQPIDLLAVSLNGERAVTSSLSGELLVWNLKTGQPRSSTSMFSLRPVTVQRQTSLLTVHNLQMLSDSQRVLIHYRHGILVWDPDREPAVENLAEKLGTAMQVKATPDGTHYVTGMYNTEEQRGDLRMWDASTLALSHRLIGHTHYTYGLEYSPDGRRMISGDKTAINEWDLKEGKLLRTISVTGADPMANGVNGRDGNLRFSPNGRWLAAGFNTVVIWDAKSWVEILRLGPMSPDAQTHVDWSADSHVLVATTRKGQVHLWDTSSITKDTP